MRERLVVVGLIALFLLALPAAAWGTQYDFGGERIGIALFQFFPGMTPLGTPGQYNWLDPDPRLQAHIEAVEAMFNVEIEFVETHPANAIMERMSTEVLSGMASFDFMQVREHDVYTLAALGYIHPLGDILDEQYYASLPSLFRSTEGFEVRGQVYGVEPQNFTIESKAVFWNKDMFEREGLPNLYDIYEAGEWTWDRFAEYAIALTKDTSGDGEIDQWGFDFAGGLATVENFILSNNGRLTKIEDGRVVVAFDEIEVLETLEFLQGLSEAGVLPYRGGHLLDGRVGMSKDIVHSFVGRQAQMGHDEYGLVPLPKGPRADDHVAPIWNRWMGVIPVTTENPRAVIEVINALYQLTETYWDVDMETWEEQYWNERVAQIVTDRTHFEVWKWANIEATLVEHRQLMNQAGFRQAVASIMHDGESPAAALAAIKPAAQAVLDELYDQD